MKSMSTFQLIVTAVFVVLIIVGVGIFALFGGLLGNSAIGTVVIWGTMDQRTMGTVIDSMKSQDKSLQDVTYVEKSAGTYDAELVNAIAAGTGPDLALISQSELGALSDKLLVIPYGAVSQSTFINSYIDEGQLFLTGQGTLGLPFSVDPLVMYWNRDLFAQGGVAQAPQYWDDVIELSPKITSLDSSQNVRQSAVALGEWDNISHAKEILSTLFLQAGEPIVSRDPQTGAFSSVLGAGTAGTQNPGESALRFYTQFANPGKSTYSWNRSLPNSSEAFASGDLAVYFGFGSELGSLAQRNPNLHFSVALLPQLKGVTARTWGDLSVLSIPRSAKNPGGAQQVAIKLTSQKAIGVVVRETGLPPVRRDVALDTSANAAAQVLSQSALISTAWFDPSPRETDGIFKTMVESVISGKDEPIGALSQASQQLSQFFQHQ
jgi:ABC-type glycerol-3-phosphate transport system substrate-binding protein